MAPKGNDLSKLTARELAEEITEFLLMGDQGSSMTFHYNYAGRIPAQLYIELDYFAPNHFPRSLH